MVLLIVAAGVIALGLQGGQGLPAPAAAPVPASAQSSGALETASASAAREWVVLLDQRRWDRSWDTAGTLFKSRMSRASWTATILPVREPFGLVTSRVLHSVAQATSLPGAPDGDYEIIQFQTAFAQKPDAVETVVLAREGGDWKVNGYFIR